jgi:hypothetical protein
MSIDVVVIIVTLQYVNANIYSYRAEEGMYQGLLLMKPPYVFTILHALEMDIF